MSEEKKEFQAEVKELLNLMIHSIYSNKEIFLRELISNATDAIDKRKFEALTNSLLQPDTAYSIKLLPNKEDHSLKIIDNGIGMSYDELIENIGTIAKSGTKQFAQMTKEMKNNPELIGQFGVGFYSSFMVADRVCIHTKKAGDTRAWFWESTGDGSYKIQELDKEEPGTSITLYFKKTEEGDKDFTEEWVLRDLVKRYSDFIAYPIQMDVMREEFEKDSEGNDIESSGKMVQKTETLNSQKALWTKSPSEISDEEYKEFYKQMTFDWQDPAKHIHYKAEGTLEFNAILYVPSKRPFNFNTMDSKWGLDLYVKKVFILSDCEDLIPSYLRFVKGVVDSSDLSLNISREMLQQDRQMTQIRKALTGKVLNSLQELLQKDRSSYESFFASFGSVLKEGIATDTANTEKIADCLLFKTNLAPESYTSLKEYVDRMRSEQKHIYFLTGENIDQLKNSPHLEALNEKSYEVLLLDDDIDEWVVSRLTKYQDITLLSAAKSDLDIDSAEEKTKRVEENKKLSEEYSEIIETMKTCLKEKVKEVRISSRLKDYPVVLVDDEADISTNMKRILAQHRGENFDSPRILEINPKHAVFEKMKKASKEEQSDWAELFYGQALLNEGSQLPDPVKFSRQINKLLI